jgi:ribosome-binding factor A
MPEDRAKRYHQERIAETVREEIDAMILGDLSDPRISSGHVTQVLLNPGGKSAEVYVQVDGGAEAEASTMEGLMAARGWIRVELKTRMGKRHVPELTFHADRSERMTGRIDELLTRTRKRNKYPVQAQPADATQNEQPKDADQAGSH